MRVVIQRVLTASVSISGTVTAAIGHPAAGEGKPTELHDQRKPLEDLVIER